MSENQEQAQAPPTEDDQQASVTAYLQAPRKKRKNFVIFALGDRFNKDLARDIINFVDQKFTALATSRPRTSREMVRQFGRNISLLVLDDEFDDLEKIMPMLKTMKVKKAKDGVPILFMTSDPDALIRSYQGNLAAYQEMDEYCDTRRDEVKQIIAKISSGIETKNRRKSRRYKTRIPISYYHLTQNKEMKGEIVDISVHGVQISSPEVGQFRLGDQLRISLPISEYVVNADVGEYLRLSGRVRRVFISGYKCGMSFEFVSEHYRYILTEFVTKMVSHLITR